MLYGQTPRWLEQLERRFGGLAIPNLALGLVGLQVLGFLLVYFDPTWWRFLILDPGLVLQGEVWRVVSFLALPLSTSPLWAVFVLYFLYFLVNGLESEWGAFATTLYLLVCVVLTVAFSLLFRCQITSAAKLESTLFLAAATIAPNYEILLFLILPVKLKWLAWATVALIILQLIFGSWMERFYLAVMYANYLLFFGPYYSGRLQQWHRRRRFHQAARADPDD